MNKRKRNQKYRRRRRTENKRKEINENYTTGQKISSICTVDLNMLKNRKNIQDNAETEINRYIVYRHRRKKANIIMREYKNTRINKKRT